MLFQHFDGTIDNIPFELFIVDGKHPLWQGDFGLTLEQQSDVLGTIADVLAEQRARFLLEEEERIKPKFASDDPNICAWCGKAKAPAHWIACNDCHHMIDPATTEEHMCIEKKMRLEWEAEKAATASAEITQSATSRISYLTYISFRATMQCMSDPRHHFSLHRTLRVPDSDGKSYNLPPSLGTFPLVACKDTRAPLAWQNDYMFPMYRSEAMWLSFSGSNIPEAVVMTASGINVLTGDVVTDIEKMDLVTDPQNYMVAPPQPWIDGIKHADGKVRQFVAVSFESGKSLGQQIAGIKDDTIKLVFYPTKNPEKYRRPPMMLRSMSFSALESSAITCSTAQESMSMGIGAGGEIDQKIYPDPHGIDEWDREKPTRVNIRVVNALMWEALTGQKPPYPPPGPNDYQYYKYPWFELYEERKTDLKPADVLVAIKSVFDGDESQFNMRPPVKIGGPEEPPRTVKPLKVGAE